MIETAREREREGEGEAGGGGQREREGGREGGREERVAPKPTAPQPPPPLPQTCPSVATSVSLDCCFSRRQKVTCPLPLVHSSCGFHGLKDTCFAWDVVALASQITVGS